MKIDLDISDLVKEQTVEESDKIYQELLECDSDSNRKKFKKEFSQFDNEIVELNKKKIFTEIIGGWTLEDAVKLHSLLTKKQEVKH